MSVLNRLKSILNEVGEIQPFFLDDGGHLMGDGPSWKVKEQKHEILLREEVTFILDDIENSRSKNLLLEFVNSGDDIYGDKI